MTLICGIVFVIACYLLGSLPQMRLIARTRGIDPDRELDLHTALWQKAGRPIGFSAIFIDVLKGAIPIIVGFSLHLPLATTTLGVVAAICGQMWPLFEKFDGEKGNTPAIGATLTLTLYLTFTTAPLAYIVLLAFAIPIVIGVAIKLAPLFAAPNQTWSQRFMFGGPASDSLPLGNLIAFAATPIASQCLGFPLQMTLPLALVFLVIVLRRLTAGLNADLKTASISISKILLNRFLYDRSYR